MSLVKCKRCNSINEIDISSKVCNLCLGVCNNCDRKDQWSNAQIKKKKDVEARAICFACREQSRNNNQVDEEIKEIGVSVGKVRRQLAAHNISTCSCDSSSCTVIFRDGNRSLVMAMVDVRDYYRLTLIVGDYAHSFIWWRIYKEIIGDDNSAALYTIEGLVREIQLVQSRIDSFLVKYKFF
jgi:hypothetical protein